MTVKKCRFEKNVSGFETECTECVKGMEVFPNCSYETCNNFEEYIPTKEQKEFDFVNNLNKCTTKDLESLMKRIQESEKKLLGAKGQEYATETDRLENFREIAGILGISETMVCGVFLLKHILAIRSYIFKGVTPSTESISEKILDARNYLLLLQAIINTIPRK